MHVEGPLLTHSFAFLGCYSDNDLLDVLSKGEFHPLPGTQAVPIQDPLDPTRVIGRLLDSSAAGILREDAGELTYAIGGIPSREPVMVFMVHPMHRIVEMAYFQRELGQHCKESDIVYQITNPDGVMDQGFLLLYASKY